MKEQPKHSGTLAGIMNFIFLTFLHGSYAYVIVSALIDAGGVSSADVFAFQFGFMWMVAAILLIFSPVVFYILEVLSIFRGEGDHAGKLFIGAEMPTFLFSLLFIVSFYAVPAAVYLYLVALCAIAFYTLQTIAKERTLQFPIWLSNACSLLGAGLFTYIGLLWLVFVPFLVYLPVLLLSAIQSLSYSFDLVSILGVFLVGVFIYGVCFIPFYGIFSYWKQLDDRALPAPQGIPKKFQGIIWKTIAFIVVFGASLLFNTSIFKSGQSILQLETKADYEAVLKATDLKSIFVTTFKNEHRYVLDKTDVASLLTSCQGDTASMTCKAYDKFVGIVLMPFIYQHEKVLPYADSGVTTVLNKVYEDEIPSEIDVTAIRQALSDLDTQGGYDSYKYKVSPILPPTVRNLVVLKTIDVSTTVFKNEGVQKTEMYLEFHNTQTTLQEAQMLLKLPEGAVVTDLTLGRDLELPSLVAPKGAANTVYEQSVVRRTDPAVIAKIAPGIYTLKVYPVYVTSSGLTDIERKNEAQKVKITYTAPISANVVLPSIMNILNTDIGYDSAVQGKISIEGVVATATSATALVSKPVTTTFNGQNSTEIAWKFDIFGTYLGQVHSIALSSTIVPYCVVQPAFSDEATVYIDTSYSAHNYLVDYKLILGDLLTKYPKLHVVDYAQVIGNEIIITSETELKQYMDSLTFVGYSMDNRLQDIVFAKNKEKRDIYIITDENAYSKNEKLTPSYAYDSVEGRMNMVMVGGFKAPLSVLGTVVSATGGSVLTPGAVSAYLSEKCQNAPTFSGAPGKMASTMVDSMKLASLNEKLLAQIKDKESYVAVGRKMYTVAGRNHFVDSMNSFIAVETEAQRQQLRAEAEKFEAFDVGPGSAPVGRIMPMFDSSTSRNWGPSNVAADANSSFGINLLGSSGKVVSMPGSGSGSSNSGETGGTLVTILVTVIFAGLGIFGAIKATRGKKEVEQLKKQSS